MEALMMFAAGCGALAISVAAASVAIQGALRLVHQFSRVQASEGSSAVGQVLS